jgi:hypothetical protein
MVAIWNGTRHRDRVPPSIYPMTLLSQLEPLATISAMNSPYLRDPARLGDVVAAIQATATYKFYKLDFEGWADRISADTTRASHWEKVFVEHPEFFRLDSERKRASLVWRRQYPKRYSVDMRKEITDQEFDLMTEEQKRRVSRTPLSAADIKTLLDTAINLHSRALEAKKDNLWYKPLLLQALAGVLGAAIGAWATTYTHPAGVINTQPPAAQRPPQSSISPQPK